MIRRYNLIILLLFSIFFVNVIYSQVESNYHGLVYNASGKSFLSAGGRSSNPALNYTNSINSGLFISPSIFGIDELKTATVFCNFGLGSELSSIIEINGSGGDLYQQFIPNIGICYQTNSFSLAGKIKYSMISIKNFSNDAVLQFDIGSTVKLNDLVSFGFLMTNISSSSYIGADKNYNQTAVFGVGANPIENLYFDVNQIIYLNYNTAFSFSASYKFFDFLSSGIAFQTNPGLYEFNLLFESGMYYFPITISYTDNLGAVYSFGFGFEID